MHRESVGSQKRFIVTLHGLDQPGTTATMMGLLASKGVSLIDLGQTVIHGTLALSMLVETPHSPTELEEAIQAVFQPVMGSDSQKRHQIEFKPVENVLSLSKPVNRYAVTLFREPLEPFHIHAVLEHLAQHQLNIDRIQKLSQNAMQCLEFLVSSSTPLGTEGATRLRGELLNLATTLGMDIAFQSDGIFRRAKRLVVFDMDSTLIGQEVIDEFARERGVYEHVAAITHSAMQGELGFEQSLRARCACLKGLTRTEVERVFQRLTLNAGVEELMVWLKKMGLKTAIVSGGFSVVAEPLRQRLGMDAAFANTMEFEGEAFTGRLIPPVVHAERKADLLESMAFQERISLEQVVAVGDGANDILMLQKAGLGIAYNAKAVVNERADVAVRGRPMTSLLFLMGLHERDFLHVPQAR